MRIKIRRVAAVVAGGVALIALVAGPAGAHVIVQPKSLPKGATDVVFSFSTPNETTDNANVTSLEIDFPSDHPLLSALAQTKAGWNAVVTTSPLAKPITTDDGTITEAVSKITWTATAGGIPPSQFDLFTVSVGQLPANTSKLEFKALEGYSDGSTVSWIEDTVKGAPAPEHPAPVLTLTGKTKKS